MIKSMNAICCSSPIAVSCLAGTAWAQGQMTSPSTPPATLPAASGRLASDVAARMAVSHGPLAGVLDKVVWDPETRGTLLVVSPETTKEVMIPVPNDYGYKSFMSGPPLEPDSKGFYQMSQIEEHFGRRVVRVHSLSVLAPTKMTILKTKGFPKPNAYGEMDESAKVKLLMSTLSPDQLRILMSPSGLGVDDLKRSQADIFISILPEPFRVDPVQNGATVVIATKNGPVGQNETILTDEQRSAVRLLVNKAIDWSHPTHGHGNIKLGNGESASGLTLRVGGSGNMSGPDGFGVDLTEEAPAFSKPSDLAYDSIALQISIGLAEAKTVGDLVQLIAAKTHAELYCDPRYRSLNVTIRGESATAGDVLHALAWAVTGTWRRVGPAFVLTDDVVGLGVRHGLVATWVQQNALLGEIRARNVDAAVMAAHQADYLNWSDSDPMKPSDALIAKAVHAAFIIPGMGSADVDSVTNRSLGDILLGRPQRTAPHRAADEAAGTTAIEFPEKGATVRAVIVTPSSADSVESAARSAKEHGFSELWLQVARGDTEAIASAVRIGAKYGLAVRPVVGLLDADAKERPELLDRNILGETVTELIGSWRGRLAALGLPDEIPGVADTPPTFAEFSDFATLWPDIPAEKAIVQFGDFLRCDSPEVESKVVEEIVKTASVHGIAGIVVRDLKASGYTTEMQTMALNRPRQSSAARDPFLAMGYSESTRLAFLRTNGVDPIDLSPLLMGERLQIIEPFGRSIDIRIPMFPEYGTTAENTNGRSSTPQGAGESAREWRAYRESLHDAFLGRVKESLKAKITMLPVVLGRDVDPIVPDSTYYGSLDRQVSTIPSPKSSPLATANARDSSHRRPNLAGLARMSSDIVYYSIAPPSASGDPATKEARYKMRLALRLLESSAWDGVVVDLSGVNLNDLLEILSTFPTASATK